MDRLDMPQVLRRLDAFFAEDDMQSAGELLREQLANARAVSDQAAMLSLRSEQVGYYRKTQEEALAMEAIDEALALCEQLSLSKTITGATVLLNCATTYKAFQRLSQALPLYARASVLYERLLPFLDYRQAGLCNNYALALCDAGEYTQALALYQKALRILQALGNNACDIAVTYVNIAHLYDAAGMPQKIPQSLQEAYAALEAQPIAARDGYYAFCCSKCAPSFQQFGFLQQGNILARRAQTIYQFKKSENSLKI